MRVWALAIGVMTGCCGIACADEAYDGRFGETAQRYADAMMRFGRDRFGDGHMPSGDDKQSGLFLSAMDRKANAGSTFEPAPFADGVPSAPAGIRQADRVFDRSQPENRRTLNGVNVGHDQQLYQLLYRLTDHTGDTAYAQAADTALGWFVRNTRSGSSGYPVESPTGLLAWGEDTAWDPVRDRPISAKYKDGRTEHEFFESWHLWGRIQSGGMANAQAVDAFALGLWNHQVWRQSDGSFNRHAWHDAADGQRDLRDYPRHAGYMIQAWSYALADTTVTANDATLLRAVATMAKRYRLKQDRTGGLIEADGQTPTVGWVFNGYELALEAWDAADRVLAYDAELAVALRQIARRYDDAFLRLAHDAAQGRLVDTVGFTATGGLKADATRYSKPWGQAYGGDASSVNAGLLIRRIEQLTGSPDKTDANHRSRLVQSLTALADFYLVSGPDTDDDGNLFDEAVWPLELASVINLQLAVYRLSQQKKYLDRATEIGGLANDNFFGSFALPRAAGNRGHYESITGGDDLALALFELDRALSVPVRHKTPDSPAAATRRSSQPTRTR